MKSAAWAVAVPLALVWLSAPAAESSAAPAMAKAAPAVERIAALRAELEAMHETDQAQRQKMTAVEREHGSASPRSSPRNLRPRRHEPNGARASMSTLNGHSSPDPRRPQP